MAKKKDDKKSPAKGKDKKGAKGGVSDSPPTSAQPTPRSDADVTKSGTEKSTKSGTEGEVGPDGGIGGGEVQPEVSKKPSLPKLSPEELEAFQKANGGLTPEQHAELTKARGCDKNDEEAIRKLLLEKRQRIGAAGVSLPAETAKIEADHSLINTVVTTIDAYETQLEFFKYDLFDGYKDLAVATYVTLFNLRYELFDAYKKLAVANYGDAKAQEMGQKGALTVRDRNPFDFPAVYREEYYPSFTGAMNGSSVFHRLSPRRKREIADAKMGLRQMTAKKDGTAPPADKNSVAGTGESLGFSERAKMLMSMDTTPTELANATKRGKPTDPNADDPNYTGRIADIYGIPVYSNEFSETLRNGWANADGTRVDQVFPAGGRPQTTNAGWSGNSNVSGSGVTYFGGQKQTTNLLRSQGSFQGDIAAALGDHSTRFTEGIIGFPDNFMTTTTGSRENDFQLSMRRLKRDRARHESEFVRKHGQAPLDVAGLLAPLKPEEKKDSKDAGAAAAPEASADPNAPVAPAPSAPDATTGGTTTPAAAAAAKDGKKERVVYKEPEYPDGYTPYRGANADEGPFMQRAKALYAEGIRDYREQRSKDRAKVQQMLKDEGL